MSDTRVRNFIFTIQENEQASIGETTINTLKGNPTIKALFIGGIECAPTTGKKHRHCVVSFHNKKSLEQAINLLAPHHVEEMRGTPRQAIDYAIKDNNEFLYNSYDFIQDKDNEQTIVELIFNNATLEEIIGQCPKTAIRKYNNIRAMYLDYHSRKREQNN